LHMDVRPVNLLTRGSLLQALIDWGNMLLGDPALEWARMTEFSGVTRGFVAAYSSVRPVPSAPRAVELLYRFDTAAMLAAVHLQFRLDRDHGRRHLERAATLRQQLLAQS